jgi:hypothetical protein
MDNGLVDLNIKDNIKSDLFVIQLQTNNYCLQKTTACKNHSQEKRPSCFFEYEDNRKK